MITACRQSLAQRPRPGNAHGNTLRAAGAIAATLLLPLHAHASLFQGEALDTVANVMAWVVLFFAPAVAIAVFWMVHILPEKIAEQRHHPQAKAIQVLCLLSLAFGGLLWPLAWLWAYSKPVLYKMAYGTDKVAPHGETETAGSEAATSAAVDDAAELKRLRERISYLEARLAGAPAAE